MNVTSKQLDHFSHVWKEILKQKIKILYTISTDKKEDFEELIEEFVPEAFEHEELWRDDYIQLPRTKIITFKIKKR
jgi:hypothetical protein